MLSFPANVSARDALSPSAFQYRSRRQASIYIGVTCSRHFPFLFLTIGWLNRAQNGSIIDGLSAWRKNVSGAIKGQTECAICYALVSVDNQLPSKKCGTCKNSFHAGKSPSFRIPLFGPILSSVVWLLTFPRLPSLCPSPLPLPSSSSPFGEGLLQQESWPSVLARPGFHAARPRCGTSKRAISLSGGGGSYQLCARLSHHITSRHTHVLARSLTDFLFLVRLSLQVVQIEQLVFLSPLSQRIPLRLTVTMMMMVAVSGVDWQQCIPLQGFVNGVSISRQTR